MHSYCVYVVVYMLQVRKIVHMASAEFWTIFLLNQCSSSSSSSLMPSFLVLSVGEVLSKVLQNGISRAIVQLSRLKKILFCLTNFQVMILLYLLSTAMASSKPVVLNL